MGYQLVVELLQLTPETVCRGRPSFLVTLLAVAPAFIMPMIIPFCSVVRILWVVFEREIGDAGGKKKSPPLTLVQALYIKSQIELRMNLAVTCVDVKLKNKPDVFPKSSCYHPSNMNNHHQFLNPSPLELWRQSSKRHHSASAGSINPDNPNHRNLTKPTQLSQTINICLEGQPNILCKPILFFSSLEDEPLPLPLSPKPVFNSFKATRKPSAHSRNLVIIMYFYGDKADLQPSAQWTVQNYNMLYIIKLISSLGAIPQRTIFIFFQHEITRGQFLALGVNVQHVHIKKHENMLIYPPINGEIIHSRFHSPPSLSPNLLRLLKPLCPQLESCHHNVRPYVSILTYIFLDPFLEYFVHILILPHLHTCFHNFQTAWVCSQAADEKNQIRVDVCTHTFFVVMIFASFFHFISFFLSLEFNDMHDGKINKKKKMRTEREDGEGADYKQEECEYCPFVRRDIKKIHKTCCNLGDAEISWKVRFGAASKCESPPASTSDWGARREGRRV
ncbi:hypothetical protein VP01_293g3 [Puccinia sorghi]|uniref:Uncharacterized protein n=1 Tax=Puccinia sorghi TaxID=27349 RepID=A0A0L6V128_9BASI|nr:hypothetical protein VP01_293g3 [Puccinia sorghi]